MMKCSNCGHDVPYSSVDNLLAEWAANKFGFKPEGFIEILFSTYDSCWSEFTHDYGVNATIYYWKDGERITQDLDEWNLPKVIEDMYEYKQAKERAENEHCGGRGYDY